MQSIEVKPVLPNFIVVGFLVLIAVGIALITSFRSGSILSSILFIAIAAVTAALVIIAIIDAVRKDYCTIQGKLISFHPGRFGGDSNRATLHQADGSKVSVRLSGIFRSELLNLLGKEIEIVHSRRMKMTVACKYHE